jgi:hypothetical protein
MPLLSRLTAAPSQSNSHGAPETDNRVWEVFGEASDEDSDESLEALLGNDLCF